jgi:endonuclease/exonuclease/phosphatase family metal-dependent hydrolase
MIQIATYNIMHGLNAGKVIDNLEFLISQGAHIICLQEADPPFKEFLDALLRNPRYQSWRVEYATVSMGGNLATLWNSNKVQFQSSEIIPLPVLKRRAVSEMLKGLSGTRRRIGLSCEFLLAGKIMRVTNVHLAWEGGKKQRLRQVIYLKKVLAEKPVDHDLIAGDFNTVSELTRQQEEKNIALAFGPGYINALPDIPWSFDIIHDYAPQDGLETVTKICRAVGITFRSRLDYFFTRNLETVSGEMFDLRGSDHRPLLAKFNLK